MTRSFRHLAVPAILFAAIVLGGSPQGIWRHLLLQLAGMGLLLWALLSARQSHPTPAARLLLLLGIAWFALILLQLVPLPPALWSALPGRQEAAAGFVLRGEALPWLPLSLVPAATAALLPVMALPLGIAAAILLLGAYRASWCIAALVIGTSLSVLLGAVQLTQGGPYLFDRVNEGFATGFFANANHQATLLLVTIPFLAALIGRDQRRRQGSKAAISSSLAAFGALAVVLIGIALNGSLAALALLGPVLVASVPLALPRRPRIAWLAGAALALLLCGAAGLALFSDADAGGASITSRAEIYRLTLAAIADSFPVGTGLGSFETFYRQYEDPATVDRFFVNHAHSDPLEWVLETGLPGLILLGALLGWWAMRAVRVWGAKERDPVALAATIASAAILGHSLVDYPLRDPAIQAIFAMSLAFMAEPRSHSRLRWSSAEPAPRHLRLDDDGALSG